MCPPAGTIFPGFIPSKVVCHCMLIETANKLVLVDTGLGVQCNKDKKQLGTIAQIGMDVDPSLTAIEQIKKVGLSPRDVTDVILTHLDYDHAGGIRDFPQAAIHVSECELKAANERKTLLAKGRYRSYQLPASSKWAPFKNVSGEKWNGLDKFQPLTTLPTEIGIISLPGHTAGHIGVVVETKGKFLLHAGDAYYDHRELVDPSQAPKGFKLFQKIVHTDYQEAMNTQQLLASLRAKGLVEVFCSHDAYELDLLLQGN